MHIAPDVGLLAQLIVQLYLANHVGLIPMLGPLPALCHHALGREIDDVFGLEFANECHQLIELGIDVDLREAEALTSVQREIGQKHRVQFRGAAHAQHLMLVAQQVLYELRAGEGVAADHQETLGRGMGVQGGMPKIGLAHSHRMHRWPMMSCKSSAICMSSSSK